MKLILSERFYPFDRIIIGYCLLMILVIAIFGRPLRGYFDELIFYVTAATAATLIAVILEERQGRAAALIRLLYAGILFGFFYRTTGGLMFLIFDGFLDPQLIAFEKAVFGFNATLYIDQFLLSRLLNELFSFCYFCYYPMIPVFLFATFIKRDYEIIRRFLAAGTLAFFVSYLLFFLYPIEGPRWFLADQYLHEIDGYFFRHLVEAVIANGAVRGGCMPSSHVAVALVIMMFCFKHYRRWGWILLPINVGLAIGTFWGRFHYVSDVFVGVAIGIAAYLLVEKKYDNWAGDKYKEWSKKELKVDFVS